MSAVHDDFAVEPIRGLPEMLPEGEHILWQGSPRWQTLARSAYHVDLVAVYFAILMVARGVYDFSQKGDAVHALMASSALLPLALSAIGLLALVARMTSRATVYTITNKRVVLRIGVALTKAINLPFSAIGSAAMRSRTDGTGDIVLRLQGDDRIGFGHLWPHVRPWQLRNPEPMLRAIPGISGVAIQLSRAMQGAARLRGASVTAPRRTESNVEPIRKVARFPVAS